MAQTLLVNFKESPFSPWGAAALTSRTPGGVSPSLANGHGSLRFQTVGSISAVNAQIVELGLKRKAFLPPLVAEETVEAMERTEGAKPRRRESADKKRPADAMLIELATFPGFTPEHHTPLPHGLDTLEHLKLVTRAQTRLAVKRQAFRECWKKLFHSAYSQAIFVDTFWWFFLYKYQPNEVVQDKLFSRVSVSYVKLLCEDCEHKWRDVFFKVYPDVVAQGVYSAFIHAFPASWSSFDDHFKTELCKTVSLWQVGTKPIPNSWQRWDLDALEPPNLLKHVGKEDQSPTSPRKGFHLDALVRETRRKTGMMGVPEPSPVRLRSPTTRSMQPGARGGIPTRTSRSQASTSSLGSSRSSTIKQGGAVKDSSRTVSFAELEKALCSQSYLLQQTENITNARTHGETTPAQQSTAVQRKRIEVAKQQLANLRMQKAIEAKAKAAGRGSKGTSSSTSKASKPSSVAIPPRNSQSRTQPPTSQAKRPPPMLQQQPHPPARVATTGKQQGSEATPFQSEATTKVATRPNPTVQVSPVGVGSTLSISSQPKPRKGGPSQAKLLPVPKPQGQDATEVRAMVSQVTGQKHLQPVATKDSQLLRDKPVGGEKESEGEEGEDQGGTWKEKALAMKKKESSMPLVGPRFEHVVFDAHGQSPLVKHYLQKRNLSYDSGYSLLLQRTEVDKLPPADAPTHQDVIRDSSKEDRKNHTQFKNHYARQKQSMVQSQQQRKRASAKHDLDVKKVLADKKEVQQLGTELAVYRSKRGEKGGDRQAAAKAIAQTLQRVS